MAEGPGVTAAPHGGRGNAADAATYLAFLKGEEAWWHRKSLSAHMHV